MAVKGEASIAKIRMAVSRRLWRRVKVVYGAGDPGEGRLEGFEGLASLEGHGLNMAFSGAEEVSRLAAPASTILAER